MAKKIIASVLVFFIALTTTPLQIQAEGSDESFFNGEYKELSFRMESDFMEEDLEYIHVEMPMYYENIQAHKEEQAAEFFGSGGGVDDLETSVDNEVGASMFSLASLEDEQEENTTVPLSEVAMETANLSPMTYDSVKPSLGALNGSLTTLDVFSRYNGTSAHKLSYINGSIGTGDIAILEAKGNRFRILISGLEGWVDQIGIDYVEQDKLQSSSHYQVDTSGNLRHKFSPHPGSTYITAGIGLNNGPAPSYLKTGVDYLSFDGHYFYTDRLVMLNDYASGVRTNSINPQNPFYNYFQFLSFRSSSNLIARDFDSYLAEFGRTKTVEEKYFESYTHEVPKDQSMLVGQTNEFVDQMARYGINSTLTFSTAIIESGWGTSYFARSRKNLFGHEAYDSFTDSATRYNSISQSIQSHNSYFLNAKYLNYGGASNLYDGAMLGNKESGVNMFYASDPYWGEKIADRYHSLDAFNGNKDYGKYTIGVVKNKIEKGHEIEVKKEANSNSATVSKFHMKNQSFIILDTVKGKTHNGSDIWYKIASDHMLDGNKDVIKINSRKPTELKYDINNSHVYVHSSYVHVANTETVLLRGDVNNDGRITLVDLALIQSHLLGNRALTGEEIARADTNNDGKISLGDLAMVKAHLLGNIKLN